MESERPLRLMEAPARSSALPPAFHLFWAGQSLSAVGDAMTTVAMPLVMLAATGSVREMGRLTSFALVGSLLSTAGAGFIIDRWDARRIMVACDVFRFALMSLVPLAWWAGDRSTALLYVVGISAAFAEGIFYVGHVALVARLVGRAQVGRANGRVQATAALAFVLGPLFAGVLSAHLGPTAALGVDSGTFVASAFSLLLIRARRAPLEVTAPGPGASLAGGLLAGWRFIREQRELLRLAVAMGTYLFFTASIVDILIYRLKNELGQGDAGVGAMFGIAAATSVVAAAVTPTLRARVPFRSMWIGALVLQGSLLLGTSGSPSFAMMAGAATLFMAPMTMLKICQASIRQEVTPPELLGRVSSTYLTLVTLPTPLGAALATALAGRFGARVVQGGIGATLLVTALAGALLWSRPPARVA